MAQYPNVRGVGDLNGDGVNEVASWEASVLIVYGRPDGQFGGSVDLGNLTLDGMSASRIEIRGAGLIPFPAGDVNGDGIDDLLVTQPYRPFGATNYPGRVFLIFGNTNGLPGNLNPIDLNGSDGLLFVGVSDGEQAGYSASKLGDINGDTIDDFVIGAHWASVAGMSSAGRAYVVFGNAPPEVLGPTVTQLQRIPFQTSNPQTRSVAQQFDAHYFDRGSESMAGVAFVGNQSSAAQGQWQISTDTTTWSSLPTTLGDSQAFVVDGATLLRFLPAMGFAGTPGELDARLWDGQRLELGANVDVTGAISSLGGLSSDRITVQVFVDEWLLFESGFE